jgi:hypothetical protein
LKETDVINTVKRFACLAMVAGLACGTLAAQVTKVGTTAAKFLSIPVGARALGMGGAFAGLADDASAMYWNPGGLARLVQSEAMFNHTEWLADIKFNYGNIVIPIPDVGVLGLGLTSMSMGEMERTTEDQPEGTGQMFSTGSFAVGVSYARNLTDWFSIGFSGKYVHEWIWNSTASGFAVDVGTLFSTPFPGLKFGAAITNFGTKMRIGGDDLLVQKDISSNNGNNPNLNANLTTDPFDLPLLLRIGVAYEPIADEDQRLVFVADAVHPNDNSESVSLGGEYTMFSRIFSVRAGYKALGMRDAEEQFTVGAGVRYTILGMFAVKVDYAFERFGRLNNVHNFVVGVLF